MTSQHRGLLFMALGFAVWIAALSALYGAQATGCEFSWQHIDFGAVSLLRGILLGLFAVHMGLLLWLLIVCRRRSTVTSTGSLDGFLWRASAFLTLAAIAATIWIGMALSLPSICR